ncbi:MAG: transcriptional regulator, MerR family [Caulobacter sp.]|nr:transcriptional regulator, MerR family [Caulobacter sp.]
MTKTNIRDLRNMSLADAARAFGLTARAIRFYNERGLIESTRDRTNARVFDAMARQRLSWISKLRQAKISLSDIGDVLSAEDQGGDVRTCALMKLESRRRALETELQRVGDLITNLSEAENRAPQRIGAVGR